MRFASILPLAALLAWLAAPASADQVNLFHVAGQSNAVGFDADPALLPADAIDVSVRFASGHTGRVDIPTQSFASDEAWSMSFWLRNTADTGGVFAGERGTSDNFLWSDRTGDKFRFRNDAGQSFDFNGLTAADDGQFHHYALVASGDGDLTLFVDGIQFGLTKTGVDTSFVIDVFGEGFSTNGFQFTGQMDEVWIIRRALSAEQVAALESQNRFATAIPAPAALPAGLGLLGRIAIRRHA